MQIIMVSDRTGRLDPGQPIFTDATRVPSCTVRVTTGCGGYSRPAVGRVRAGPVVAGESGPAVWRAGVGTGCRRRAMFGGAAFAGGDRMAPESHVRRWRGF